MEVIMNMKKTLLVFLCVISPAIHAGPFDWFKKHPYLTTAALAGGAYYVFGPSTGQDTEEGDGSPMNTAQALEIQREGKMLYSKIKKQMDSKKSAMITQFTQGLSEAIELDEKNLKSQKNGMNIQVFCSQHKDICDQYGCSEVYQYEKMPIFENDQHIGFHQELSSNDRINLAYTLKKKLEQA